MFTTVPARHCAVIYRRGHRVGVAGPGRYWRRWGQRYVVVDQREAHHVLAPQEIPTADGLPVRVTAVVRWEVADPVAWLERAQDPVQILHVATQLALRDAVAQLPAEQLVTQLRTLDVTRSVDDATRAVGIATLQVAVRDVVLPAELKAAATQLAAVRARATASLEAARAETAALRALANGARLLDDHPRLAQLRMVQSAPAGTRLVLQVGEPHPDASSR